MRFATFNIENLDDQDVDPERDAPFSERIKVLRPIVPTLGGLAIEGHLLDITIPIVDQLVDSL